MEKLAAAGSQAASEVLLFYIGLLHPKSNLCSIPNQLILDGVMKGYGLYKGEAGEQRANTLTTQLNGNNYEIEFGVSGDYQSINAIQADKLLTIYLTKTDTPPQNKMSSCEDTPWGFKLSEIMDRLHDVSKIKADQKTGTTIPLINGWNNIAHLFIVQKASRITMCGNSYVKVVFTIKNVGSSEARRVLFKDILPNGVVLNKFYIDSNGDNRSISQNHYKVLGRGLFIDLPNIPVSGSLNINLILCVSSCPYIKDVNVGCISYVAWHGVKTKTTPGSVPGVGAVYQNDIDQEGEGAAQEELGSPEEAEEPQSVGAASVEPLSSTIILTSISNPKMIN